MIDPENYGIITGYLAKKPTFRMKANGYIVWLKLSLLNAASSRPSGIVPVKGFIPNGNDRFMKLYKHLRIDKKYEIIYQLYPYKSKKYNRWAFAIPNAMSIKEDKNKLDIY